MKQAIIYRQIFISTYKKVGEWPTFFVSASTIFNIKRPNLAYLRTTREITTTVSSNYINKYLLAPLMLCVALCSYSSAVLANNGDYAKGMTAYMNNDFELAQSFWVKAARDNNAKAMFNLGLLHEQRKVKKANKVNAERWFKLAGQNGYGPADLHIAIKMIHAGDDRKKVEQALGRAVDNGSRPARDLLTRSRSGQDITDIVKAKFQNTAAAKPIVRLKPGQYHAESWIKRQRSSAWTIQMLAFRDVAKVRDFIDQHGLHDQAAYFAEKTHEGKIYKLVYGVFSDKQAADEARDALSPALKDLRPWLRSIASVKTVIAKQ